MAARFNGTNSRLENLSPAVTGVPFTVALWYLPLATGINTGIWHLGSTSVSDFWHVGTSTTQYAIVARDGAGEVSAGAGSPSIGGWAFLVARFTSATNRRLSVIDSNGAVSHVQSTTSRSPSSINTAGFGCRRRGATLDRFANGMLGEYWLTNTDIQEDGAQLQDSTLRQLAYQGPFSLPHIAKDIIEYRSFRSRLDSRADTPDEVYHRGTRQVWTNTNGVTLGPHPPAADNYVSPLTEQAPMVIV